MWRKEDMLSVSNRYGVPMDDILYWNGIDDAKMLKTSHEESQFMGFKH